MPAFTTADIMTTVSFDPPSGTDLETIQNFCEENPILLPLVLGRSTKNERLRLDLDHTDVVDHFSAVISLLGSPPPGLALGFSLYDVNALNSTEVPSEIPELIRTLHIEVVTITKEPTYPTRRTPAIAARLTMKGVLPLSAAMSRIDKGTAGSATDVPLNGIADVEEAVRPFHEAGFAPPSGVLHLGMTQSVAMRDTPLPEAAVFALHQLPIHSIRFTNLDRFCW